MNAQHFRLITICGLLLPLLLLTGSLEAQNFADGFNFYLPATDTASSRFLPSFPAAGIGAADFISIDSRGHFSRNGQPVRFWGTNLVADGAFPTPSKSWFIAGRLRKLGFNLVRFHHLDNPWSAGSLLEWGTDTRHLNPATLSRMESIIAALKANGIYIDMNLNVGRTFTTFDGVPEADSLPEFGKGVTQFDPWLITLQKEYAFQLLTHVNPHTGLALRDDPVMAMMEIANENSLYRFWREGRLSPFSAGGSLTVRHNRMLDSLWNLYLLQKYGTTDSLRQAWSRDTVTSAGTDQVRNGLFESAQPAPEWILELHETSQATMGRDSVSPRTGTYSARVHVQQATGIDWHIQMKQIGLRVVKDSSYTVTFAGRSDSIRSIIVSVLRDVSPWTGYGWSGITLTPEWQEFSFSFTAPESCLTETRLSFSLGVQAGTYWFDDIALSNVSVRGLLAGEDLDSGSVRRTPYLECPGFSPGRVEDISSFYIGLERDYFRGMVSYLRDTLNVQVPIVGTNWNVGPADLAAQTTEVDFVDNHAYWQHPWFPTVPWSSTDWQIENTPMVTSADGGTIPSLMAGVGRIGRPLTASEYGHPFPSRYQTEGPLFMSAYGSFHDVDALMLYEYNQSSGTDWEADFVNGFFDNHRNTSLMALMPSVAYAYRNFLVDTAAQTLQIAYAPSDYLQLPRKDNGWWEGPSQYPRTIALQHAIRIGTFGSPVPMDFGTFPPPPVSPFISDTRQITWNTAGLLSVATPRFAAMTGELHNFAGQSAGPMRLNNADGFGTLTWISLTPDSLRASSRSLLTLSSVLQNTNMVWDGTTSVHDQWGTAPTLMKPLHLTVRLNIVADLIRIIPLDGEGKARSDSFLVAPTQQGVFDIPLDQAIHPTVWFAIETRPAEVAQYVAVSQGWSLVSLPAEGTEHRASTLFPTATSGAYAFSDRYFMTETLTPGRGYWLKFDDDQVVGIAGTPLTSDTISVRGGWNMVGSLAAPIPSSTVASEPSGIILSGFYQFAGGYLLADTLRPGSGYWVKVSQSGNLLLSTSGQTPSGGRTPLRSPESGNPAVRPLKK